MVEISRSLVVEGTRDVQSQIALAWATVSEDRWTG